MVNRDTFGDFTVDDFIHGNPTEIAGATESPKILVFGPHGDEHLAPRIGHHLATERPDLLVHVDYVCGNPRAAAVQTRDTLNTSKWELMGLPEYQEEVNAAKAAGKELTHGSDLNRSFSPQKGQPQTYEEFRARGILNQIEQRGYDYVLDVHTSWSDVDRFLLIANRSPAVERMIAASPYTKIAFMPVHIAKVALIGKLPNAISVEYDRELANQPEAIEEAVVLLEGLISGVPQVQKQRREFYYVTGTIPLDTPIEPGARNFEMSNLAGVYPVIHSEESYKGKHQGFGAREQEVIEM